MNHTKNGHIVHYGSSCKAAIISSIKSEEPFIANLHVFADQFPGNVEMAPDVRYETERKDGRFHFINSTCP